METGNRNNLCKFLRSSFLLKATEAPTEHYSPTESMMNNNVFATFKDNFLLSPYKSHLNSALLILIVFAWITLTSLDLQNVHIIMKI